MTHPMTGSLVLTGARSANAAGPSLGDDNFVPFASMDDAVGVKHMAPRIANMMFVGRVTLMDTPGSNIEAVARAICASHVAPACVSAQDLANTVNRLWHTAAAQIEADLMDETGTSVAGLDDDAGLDAVLNWRARHLDYIIPPWRPPARD